jgi:hypothetical protein
VWVASNPVEGRAVRVWTCACLDYISISIHPAERRDILISRVWFAAVVYTLLFHHLYCYIYEKPRISV